MGCDVQWTLCRVKPCDDMQTWLIHRTLRLLCVFQCDTNLRAALASVYYYITECNT